MMGKKIFCVSFGTFFVLFFFLSISFCASINYTLFCALCTNLRACVVCDDTEEKKDERDGALSVPRRLFFVVLFFTTTNEKNEEERDSCE